MAYRVIVTVSIISLWISNFPGITSLNYECIPSSQQAAGIGVANCSRQQLAHVPPNLPHNIKILDLSNNYITELTDNSFVKYEYLEVLHLHNNSLRRLESKAFNRLRNVLYLDMSFNNLEAIPSQSFLDLKALLTLSLRGNRITSIPAGVFTSVSKLTNIYLSGNHISNIHPEAFRGLRNLQQLELQNNAMSQLNGSVFKYFTTNLKEIKLFHNPWYCDCNLRWLIQWLTNSSGIEAQRLRWRFNMDEPMCHGPSIVEKRAFSSLTGESFICPISMYSKARNVVTVEGSEVELFCKYMADPYLEIQWLKNGNPVNLQRTDKFKVEIDGAHMITSRLHIYNFKYRDIGEYECYAENQLGEAYDSCLVTLEGVDPAEVIQPSTEDLDNDSDRVRNAIIASSTIGGVVILLVIIIILFCCLSRCKQYHRRKKESIRMSFEEHLKANGIIEPNPKHEQIIYDEVPDEPSMEGDLEEPESAYNSLQRQRIPSSTNTNTYISFKSELSDQEDMTQMYSQGQQTNSTSNSKGSDGSQCESTSPLLENISPILIDPHDPFYVENLYVPRLYASTNHYLSSTNNNDYDDDEYVQRRIDSDFIPYRDIHGFILPGRSNGHGPFRANTLPYHGHSGQIYREPMTPEEEMYIPHKTRTLPHGYTPQYAVDYGSTPVVRSNSVSANHKSASVGHLGICPPKKPPRSFHSRDTVSLYSQHSGGDRDTEFKLSLPKPGTVDQYGTAV